MAQHGGQLIWPVLVEAEKAVEDPVFNDRQGRPVAIVGLHQVREAAEMTSRKEVKIVEKEPLTASSIHEEWNGEHAGRSQGDVGRSGREGRSKERARGATACGLTLTNFNHHPFSTIVRPVALAHFSTANRDDQPVPYRLHPQAINGGSATQCLSATFRCAHPDRTPWPKRYRLGRDETASAQKTHSLSGTSASCASWPIMRNGRPRAWEGQGIVEQPHDRTASGH